MTNINRYRCGWIAYSKCHLENRPGGLWLQHSLKVMPAVSDFSLFTYCLLYIQIITFFDLRKNKPMLLVNRLQMNITATSEMSLRKKCFQRKYEKCQHCSCSTAHNTLLKIKLYCGCFKKWWPWMKIVVS